MSKAWLCILFGIFFASSLCGCASTIYQNGNPYKDKSIHIQYGKYVDVHYGIGVFMPVKDEKSILKLPKYVSHDEKLQINTDKVAYLAFDGYINNWGLLKRKVGFYLCYEKTDKHGNITTHEKWIFDTSLPARKYQIKCPLTPGSSFYCFLTLKNEKQFDLPLPGIHYKVVSNDIKVSKLKIVEKDN